MYKFGTIVLIPFPFTDLTSTKLRPALIVSRTNEYVEDVIVAFITSKVSPDRKSPHFVLLSSDRHFSKTGLKTDSVIRFDKLATLSKRLILGELGVMHPFLLKKIKAIFFSAFGFHKKD